MLVVVDYSVRLRFGVLGFSIEEQLLRRNVKWFRGGLVFKAHRILYHSTLGFRIIKKKNRPDVGGELDPAYAPAVLVLVLMVSTFAPARTCSVCEKPRS